MSYSEDSYSATHKIACDSKVKHLTVDCGELPAAAEFAWFCGADGVEECHLTVRLKCSVSAGESISLLAQAYQFALDSAGMDLDSAVFRRVFCSDVTNQSEITDHPMLGRQAGGGVALSLIGQAPLPSTKLALWAYHIKGKSGSSQKSLHGDTLSFHHGELVHHWAAGLIDTLAVDSHAQTQNILGNYDAWLSQHSMAMAQHVVRTWWFMQNIDADYQGLVDARCDFFSNHGLTPDTHYLASTGIAGSHPNTAAKVVLDAYSISGLQDHQLQYLSAPQHLCPTHDYGVTFERATAVSFSDRKHVYISGTASIDASGRILHERDVIRQLDRTLENIDALLRNLDAGLGDLVSAVVYLRDPADGVAVECALSEKLSAIPYILVHAPVCRPGWLIEIEAIAVVPANLPHLPTF